MKVRRHIEVGLLSLGLGLGLGSTVIYGQDNDSKMSASSKLSSNDSDFVNEAAEGGKAEVQFAKLALQKSSNPDVKEFANRMVRDHSKANRQLMKIASSKGIKLPSGIGVKNNAEMLKLKALSAENFDRSYVDLMVDDHKEDVAAFEKASQGADDSEIKSFAAKTLPTLEEHYKLIQDLQGKMKAK